MLEAVAYAVAAVIVLELIFLLLRRLPWSPRVRVLYQLWAASVGVTVALALGDAMQSPGWRIAASVTALLTALVLFSLVDTLVFQRPWDPAAGPIMPKLVRDVLRIVVLAAAVIVVATAILHQPLPAVLVSSTVLSAVIGLALQDVLKNVFAGMALEVEKPFERGDWLQVEGQPQTVQVLDTSWRSVRLRTRDGIDLWEPNGVLATSRLVNFGSGSRPIGINFRVHVVYDAPPARVKEALLEAARAVVGTVEPPVTEVYLQNFDEQGVQYRMRVWTRALADLSRFQDQVNSRIWYELHRRGLAIPFPVRTVMLRHADREEQQAREQWRQQAAGLLRGVQLFSDLDDSVLWHLAGGADQQHYDDGEVLVREGDFGDSLFVIVSGQVQITKSGADLGTDAITLASMGAGGFFGEMSLLTGEPRSATVTADGGCEVLVIAKQALAPLLEQDPELAARLSAAVVARQARTAATLEDRRDRARDPVEARAELSLLARIRGFFRLPPSNS
jgi:small-conductance mechanosensitive channel/CRP-like cAMP-binding protein